MADDINQEQAAKQKADEAAMIAASAPQPKSKPAPKSKDNLTFKEKQALAKAKYKENKAKKDAQKAKNIAGQKQKEKDAAAKKAKAQAAYKQKEKDDAAKLAANAKKIAAADKVAADKLAAEKAEAEKAAMANMTKAEAEKAAADKAVAAKAAEAEAAADAIAEAEYKKQEDAKKAEEAKKNAAYKAQQDAEKAAAKAADAEHAAKKNAKPPGEAPPKGVAPPKGEAPPASTPDQPSKQVTDSKPPPTQLVGNQEQGGDFSNQEDLGINQDQAAKSAASTDAMIAASQSKPPAPAPDQPSPQITGSEPPPSAVSEDAAAAEAVKSAETVGDDAATKVQENAAAAEAVKSAATVGDDAATKVEGNAAAEEAVKSAKATGDVAGQGSPPPPQLPPEKFFPNPAIALEKSVAIDIFSVPTMAGVSFGAFVTSFTDSYTCNWNSVNASGRMDPIQTFQNTQRVIRIEWDVIAGSVREAATNFEKCQRLVQMMYPTWAEGGKASLASSVNSPPYFKFKFANLAASKPGPSGASDGEAAKSSGLFGTVGGVDVAPDFDVGVYVSGGNIYPKLISLSLEITVLHEHMLGHPKGKPSPNFGSFPYRVTGMAPGGASAWVGEETVVVDDADAQAQAAAVGPESEGGIDAATLAVMNEVAAEQAAAAATDQQKKAKKTETKKVLNPVATPK